MTPERWQLILEILEAALELEPEEALRLIEERCAGDEEMKAILLSLYKALRRRNASFEIPAPEIVAQDMALRAQQPMLQEGQHLGEGDRYEICEQLGKGGFAQVYKARDTKLNGRYVAIKIFAPSPENKSADALRRFRDEVLIVSGLGHPNIVTVLDIGKHAIEGEGDTPFIVTEFIDGITLRQYLKQHSRIEIPKALDIAMQLANGLKPVHENEKRIVHRDIKPENIMLGAHDLVKIFDFGVAKLTRKELFASESYGHEDTKSGAIIGSNKYMSPEQLRGARDVDTRSDIWAVGVVLYEMIAGRVPFDGPTRDVVSHRILSGEKPRPLSKYASEVKPELDRVVSRALSKDREKRYQKIQDLFLELQKLKATYSTPKRTIDVKAIFLNFISRLSKAWAIAWAMIFKSKTKGLSAAIGMEREGVDASPATEEETETRIARPRRANIATTLRTQARTHRKELLLASVALLLLFIMTGLFTLNSRRTRSPIEAPLISPSPSAEPTPTIEAPPSPTPTPSPKGRSSGSLVWKRNLSGQRGVAWAVALSPDGKLAASGNENNEVLLWDTNSWRPRTLLSPLKRRDNTVTSIAFSHDSEMVASSSKDKDILLWRREDEYSQPKNLTGHTAGVNVLAFSPKERLLASGGQDGSIILWDTQAAKPYRQLKQDNEIPAQDKEILAIAFSPDGNTLASASRKGEIRIWDLQRPGEFQVLCGDCGQIYALAFSCDGKILVSGGADNRIRKWDWQAKRELKLDENVWKHDRFVSSLAFAPGCKSLVSASGDSTIRIWDLMGREIGRLEDHSHRGVVNSISFSNNGMLISSSRDGTIKIWQFAGE